MENARESKVRTYEACSVIPANKLLVEEEDAFTLIHMFGSILNVTACAEGLPSNGLLIPHEKKLFEERSQKLQSRYKKIGDWAKKELSQIPPWERRLITSHDAFRYLGEAFDIKVIALQGISTATEVGLGDRANLVDFVKENKVPALFVERGQSTAQRK